METESVHFGYDYDFESFRDFDNDYYRYLASRDDHHTVTFGYYDEIFGQIFNNSSRTRGNPPAAKRVVEELPVVEFSVEELSQRNLVCAVCRKELVAEEKINRLPCLHFYHRDCIVPWLRTRNTCPLCRYELPAD